MHALSANTLDLIVRGTPAPTPVPPRWRYPFGSSTLALTAQRGWTAAKLERAVRSLRVYSSYAKSYAMHFTIDDVRMGDADTLRKVATGSTLVVHLTELAASSAQPSTPTEEKEAADARSDAHAPMSISEQSHGDGGLAYEDDSDDDRGPF